MIQVEWEMIEQPNFLCPFVDRGNSSIKVKSKIETLRIMTITVIYF